MEYKIIYSDRKTISLSVKDEAPIVRAPKSTPDYIIESFVNKHRDWILRAIRKQKEKSDKFSSLTENDIRELKLEAKKYFKDKTEYYANIMGINYGRITITSAKTRFGSCSAKGNIAYSYRLMLYPERAREYVVVHELSHVIEMNHSKRFYAIVKKFMPDYKKVRQMLK